MMIAPIIAHKNKLFSFSHILELLAQKLLFRLVKTKEVVNMKRVALIHTVKSVYDSFPVQLRDAFGLSAEELKIHNIMDDFLADDPADRGEFSTVNKARLYNDIKSAEMTGADLIVVTCSTLSPTVAQIRPFVKTRIVTIDEAMAAEAVKNGTKIGLLATANSTVGASCFKLEEEAAKIGKTIEIELSHDEDAIRALKAGDITKHNVLVVKMAQKLHNPDIIVLAQASMAPMEAALREQFEVPVYSSPALCIAQVREILRSQK